MRGSARAPAPRAPPARAAAVRPRSTLDMKPTSSLPSAPLEAS
jgi:hypothetical protein